MEIGLKIKELRQRAELTQEELANRCDLSKSFISQLENDLTSPSISTLEDILLALGTDLPQFFSVAKEERVVFTADDYFESEDGKVKTTWLITNSQKNEMEPILVTVPPNTKTTADMPHEGEEFGYVVEGEIMLHIGDNVYRAGRNDSFYYASDRSHYLENKSDREAKVLWISSPPNF